MNIEKQAAPLQRRTKADKNAETVRLPLTVSKDTHKKIIERRKKLGLTHDQDLLRLIVALYFERTE